MANLRAFEVFLAVVDAGSISRAARTLHLTQPAVSHQIGSLERDLGVTVLDRGRRGATLTAAGRAFAPAARVAVDAARRAEDVARGTVPLRIVVAQSFTEPFIVPVLRSFHASGALLPRLTEGASATSMVEAVRRGEQDVAVVPGPVVAPDLVVRSAGYEEVVAAGVGSAPGSASTSGPASGSPTASVSLDTVVAGPFIGIDPASGYGQWLVDVLAGRAVSPVTTVGSPRAAAALANAGLGVAVVPVSAVGGDHPRAPLDPPLRRDVVVVARSLGPWEAIAGPLAEAVRAAWA
jgi:DNA-binding transcriptional LysR family regulator